MRHENQPWDAIGVSLEVVSGGVGVNGLALTTRFVIRRVGDGLFWNRNANTWDASPPATSRLVEVDAVNLPGVYRYVIPAGFLDETLGRDGYNFSVAESTFGAHENGMVMPDPVRGGVWKELVVSKFSAATNDFANLVARMLALRQDNMRMVPSAWDATTNQPTAGTILIYASKADLLADVNPFPLAIGRYSFTATFNGSGQNTSYISVRDA